MGLDFIDDSSSDKHKDASEEVQQVFIQQAYQAIHITLGALISYLNSVTFEEFSEEERDTIFNHVINTWSMILPSPVDEMWDKQILLLSFTQQLQNVVHSKQEEENENKAAPRKQPKPSKDASLDARLEYIFNQLGWEK